MRSNTVSNRSIVWCGKRKEKERERGDGKGGEKEKTGKTENRIYDFPF